MYLLQDYQEDSNVHRMRAKFSNKLLWIRTFSVGLMRLSLLSHSCIENVNYLASRELWQFFSPKLDIRIKFLFLIGFFLFSFFFLNHTLDFIWISSVFLLMFLLVFDSFSIFPFFLSPHLPPKTLMVLRSTGHISCGMSQICICLIFLFFQG